MLNSLGSKELKRKSRFKKLIFDGRGQKLRKCRQTSKISGVVQFCFITFGNLFYHLRRTGFLKNLTQQNEHTNT